MQKSKIKSFVIRPTAAERNYKFAQSAIAFILHF